MISLDTRFAPTLTTLSESTVSASCDSGASSASENQMLAMRAATAVAATA